LIADGVRGEADTEGHRHIQPATAFGRPRAGSANDRALRKAEAEALDVIASGAALTTVLETIARAVDECVPDTVASILLLDADGVHLRHGGAPGLPETFNRAIDGRAIGPCAGSCGTAAWTRRPVIVTDITVDPLWTDFRDLAERLEFRACWSIPVLDEAGKVLATFALYGREPRAPDEHDIALIERFSHLAGIAIRFTRQRESLRESEERFRFIAHTAADIVWDWNLKTGMVLWSDQYRRSALRGDNDGLFDRDSWAGNVHPDDRARVVSSIRAAIDQRRSDWSEEYRFRGKSGEWIDIEDHGRLILDENGTPARFVGGMIDITARKHMEARLRENEERFRIIARTTVDRFWDWNLVTGQLWWAGSEGGSEESNIGTALGPDLADRIWGDRLHPDDRDRIVASFGGAIERRERFWLEQYRYRNSDGVWIELEDKGQLILDADGRPVRFMGGMTDITARVRAERALRERIKELRCLYRVVELTGDDTRAVEAICGDIAALLPPSTMHEDIAVARIVVDGHEHRSPGWRAPVATLCAPVAPVGHPQGLVEIGYSAARPDQPEGEGPFLAEERALVNAIAARITRMIDERRLAETVAQSDRLRSVGELTGGIAHDFNNLLTIMLGNSEILTAALTDRPHLQEMAQIGMDAAERGAALTRRLLAFARKQPLDPKAADVAALISGMDGLLRRTLGEQVEIATVFGQGLWRILVDAPQLESALLNLCINARDAMPDGGRLTIEARNVDVDDMVASRDPELAPGEYVMLVVSDTGTGMTPEVQARAFDPFFTTKGVGGGSGLGLSMVYGFVKQSKGHVRVYSEPGTGTAVKLYLPRASALETRVAERTRTLETPRGSERILLVEDDAMVRQHVVAQLTELGYRVVDVEDGPSALAILIGGEPFDLLFTDMVMPGGMGGRELAEAACRLRPGLPVLFTSGYTEDTMVMEGRLERGVHLLHKPYRRNELATKLREALAR
jgi:PAS domain S-box-containing protein